MSRGAFYVLFTASGFAGLIYESIWTHYLKLFLGHAAYAQSLVLVVFMGGMAAGAALCARYSARIANPLAAYAVIEALIGLAALAFHALFVALTDWSHLWLLPALGEEWLALGAKLALCCLLILPQSVLLGMTFPLMSAGLARAHPRAAGESVAMLYFTNSLGAAAGVLTSGFVLIAWVGLPGTLRTAGMLNLLIAAAVWLLARPLHHLPLETAQRGAAGARLLLAVAFLTGLASFVYEIAWIRMLSLVLGSSTHAFELMLSTFILGLALGGLAVRRHVDAAASPERLLGWVQVAMGLATLATLPLYNFTFELMEALMRGLAGLPYILPLPGPATERFQPIAADDLARGIAKLVTGETAPRETVFAAGPETLSVGDILRQAVDGKAAGPGLGLRAGPVAVEGVLARDRLVPIVHETTYEALREVSPLLGSRSGLSTSPAAEGSPV